MYQDLTVTRQFRNFSVWLQILGMESTGSLAQLQCRLSTVSTVTGFAYSQPSPRTTDHGTRLSQSYIFSYHVTQCQFRRGRPAARSEASRTGEIENQYANGWQNIPIVPPGESSKSHLQAQANIVTFLIGNSYKRRYKVELWHSTRTDRGSFAKSEADGGSHQSFALHPSFDVVLSSL